MRKQIAEKPFSGKQRVSYRIVQDYLSAVFQYAKKGDGFLCIRSGPASCAAQSFLSVGKLDEIGCELSRHDYRDCFFSFATYKGGLHPQRSEARALNIFAFGIDIDYANESASPEDVWQFVSENTCLPEPSFIEFGHRLRLIYILREPLRLFPKQRAALLRAFRLLQRCLCDYINEELSFAGSFGAEPTPPTSFFRIPGSVNTKNGATVKVCKISDERYTFRELFDDWILDKYTDPSGNRGEWYSQWKAKVGSRRKPRAPRFTSKKLWERRAAVLEESRALPGVHRRKTLFAYSCALAWMDYSKEEILSACLEFNSGFLCPLPENKVLSLVRSSAGKLYKFTDANLAAYLELPEGAFKGASKRERDAERYRKARAAQIRRGAAKFQKIAKRRAALNKLLSGGESLSTAARLLRISLSTIKRDAAFLRASKPACNSINDFSQKIQAFLRSHSLEHRGLRADAAQSLSAAPVLHSRQQKRLGGGAELVGRSATHRLKPESALPGTPFSTGSAPLRNPVSVAANWVSTLRNVLAVPPTVTALHLRPSIDIYIQAEKNEPPFRTPNPAPA